jgi:hypothetical protein
MFRFFEAQMNHTTQARRQFELEQRRAAALQEFDVYYQPHNRR